MVHVELVFAGLDFVFKSSLSMPLMSTVEQALVASLVYESHPETKVLAVGIFSKQVARDTILREGDRIEIYRALSIDPKANRRKRARLKK